VHVRLEGTLSTTRSSVTVVVPVDTSTQALGFSVAAPSQSDPSQRLEVEQVSLVDEDGNTVAQFGPLLDPQTAGPPDAVTLALNHAPAGGSLIVQIAAPLGGTGQTAAGLTIAGNTAGGTFAFVMDVQRLESNATGAAATGALTSSGGNLPTMRGTPIGTLNWTSNSSSADSATNTSASTDIGPGDSAPAVIVNQGSQTPTGGEIAGSDAPNPGDYSGRIALGPLASRGAAPLGPNLATVMADPAPSLDRYERGLSQEIDEHDAQTGDGPVARSVQGDGLGEESAGIDQASPVEERGLREGNFVAIAGLGAMPLKVSATTGATRVADLDALLAALPGASRGEAERAVAGDNDVAVDPLLVSLTLPVSSSQHDRRVAPDYLTSACILALGMGLTAGPLIPDLLRLIPSRSSRWRFAPAISPGLSDGTASRKRGFGHWLRRRIV
jgi:hypothetical protein